MPHVDTQTRLIGSRIDEVWQELRRLQHNNGQRQRYQEKKRLKRQQAEATSAGATKQMKGFKRWVATKRVENIGIKRNWWKGDLPEEVFQEALAIAEKEMWGRRTQVVVKNKVVTSADAASSTSADAASSSPSAVPPPRFKVEITWSDDKVGDGDRWFV